MTKKKCDVIIPVYNAPSWVKLCIYALFKNTDDSLINNVYLINDKSDELTYNCLNNLCKKYEKIKLINNKENLGFIKTVNSGLAKVEADYALLLNTDCIISKNTIEKLINHIERDKDIGLICPISSNAANLTLELFDGFTYQQMNSLLERKFSGKSFDACTVVGNCLLITKKCLDEVGYLDEIYGTGYGEETDYQFKAMEKGFKAKVAIDTYVFHKSEVSFGVSKEKKEKLEKNRKIFFERWGNDYYKLMKEYQKNDPIDYILKNINEDDKKITFEFLIYLIGIVPNAGGVHIPVDIVNYMAINNMNSNITYNIMDTYDEIMLFKPIQVLNIKKYNVKKIVSTLYTSVYYAKHLADDLKIPHIYFAQGYEPLFENGTNYGIAELSYKLPDQILTISSYLQDLYKENFNVESKIVLNGINTDLLNFKNSSKKINNITICLRGNPLKGDFIALDILKRITNTFSGLKINVLYNNEYQTFPFNNSNNEINYIYGNASRESVIKILHQTDVYIDTSLSEGFGLMPLEAMASGAIPIVSDSGGINDYIKNNINGFIIDKINKSEEYVKILEKLINLPELYQEIKNNLDLEPKKFDIDNTVREYINYFKKAIEKREINLTKEEKELYNKVLDSKFRVVEGNNAKGITYKICRMVPLKIRIIIKKVVAKLYKFTNER